jgi:hypothetical protein
MKPGPMDSRLLFLSPFPSNGCCGGRANARPAVGTTAQPSGFGSTNETVIFGLMPVTPLGSVASAPVAHTRIPFPTRGTAPMRPQR